MRFATKGGTVNSPDALAALALVRALTARLIDSGDLTPADIDRIRERALGEVPDDANEGRKEARRLIRDQFP